MVWAGPLNTEFHIAHAGDALAIFHAFEQ